MQSVCLDVHHARGHGRQVVLFSVFDDGSGIRGREREVCLEEGRRG